MGGLFVLGGNFWDKVRALFIHGAKAHFPTEREYPERKNRDSLNHDTERRYENNLYHIVLREFRRLPRPSYNLLKLYRKILFALDQVRLIQRYLKYKNATRSIRPLMRLFCL